MGRESFLIGILCSLRNGVRPHFPARGGPVSPLIPAPLIAPHPPIRTFSRMMDTPPSLR